MRAAALAVAAMLVVAAAFAQAPVPVAERIVHHGDSTTRVSLFTNGMVVVSMDDGSERLLRTHSLPEDQYFIYLGILEGAAAEVGDSPVLSEVDTTRDRAQITLHVGPAAPRTFVFSPMAVLSLPLSRIVGALNDIEALTLSTSQSAETLRDWQPQRGDRVELLAGGTARVVEVLKEGVVILQHETTYIREVVPPAALDQVVLRVLEPAP